MTGICSTTVGHPLETVKVRQQMSQNSMSALHYTTSMMKNEGVDKTIIVFNASFTIKSEYIIREFLYEFFAVPLFLPRLKLSSLDDGYNEFSLLRFLHQFIANVRRFSKREELS